MRRIQNVLLGSMAAYVACFGLTATAEAATLEEAIKGVEVSGFLRYRFTGDRFENIHYADGVNGDTTKHNFRTNINLSTPLVDSFKMNLGIVYNASNTTNTGSVMFGSGLGAGSDQPFSVATFFATLAPCDSKTEINAGKMRVNAPFNDTTDDRVTGITVTSKDIQGITLHAAFYDTWSLDDGAAGIDFGTNDSITRPYYLASVGLDMEGFGATAMYAGVQDLYNYMLYFNLGYNHPNFHVKAEYVMAQLDKDGFSRFLLPATPIVENHALMTLEAGAKISLVDAKVGYIGSGSDGFKVSMDDQGEFSSVGRIWNMWDGSGRGSLRLTYSPLDIIPTEKESLNVFYGSLGLSFLENDALRIAIDYVNGVKENKATTQKVNFQEIAPYITYKYNPKWNFLFFYTMLTAQQDSNKASENPLYPNAKYADAKYDRYRFEARYNF